MNKVTITIDQEKLEEIKKETGINLVDLLRVKGAEIIEEKSLTGIRRLIVLNKGAHDIEPALRRQFGDDVEIIIVSTGNLNFDEIEDTAIKAAREYKEGDAIVLTGPGLLIALTVLYIQTKTPQKIRLVQYDLGKREYRIFETDHLSMRQKLSQG